MEDVIQDKLDQKRRELEIAAGIHSHPRKHFRRPREHRFTRDQRDSTTIIFGGLTRRHERLIEGAFHGLGYRCKALPTSDLEAYEIGKEYQNNGYCNPAYFTVGNLIKYLLNLEASGMRRRDIIDNYVLLTAGTCGTCRFGMYEAEYRLALRNAGFDGFRVLTFGLESGFDQSSQKAGIEMNLDFFLALINALNMGDILNQLSFQIRPYEVEPGRTDAVMSEVLDDLNGILGSRERFTFSDAWKRLLVSTKFEKTITVIAQFVHQIANRDLVHAMEKARKKIDEIEIDPFQIRPVVKVLGEFWAQLTDGDGNFNMFPFLEGERADVLVDRGVSTRLMYILHQIKAWQMEKRDVYEAGEAPPFWRLDRRLAHRLQYHKKVGALTLLERIFKRENDRLLAALGGTLHEMLDQYELAELARPYYDWRCGSGEGHLEIAENIYYHTHDLCHMVLSLKPFGCLPSTQSDGVQIAVMEHYDDMIYLPIETTGDSEVIAYSRVQMALGNARAKAKQEFERALAGTGRRLEELKNYVDNHTELKRPTYYVPNRKGIAGRAANFVLHVADLMDNGNPPDERSVNG